jgi:hypothetical protein
MKIAVSLASLAFLVCSSAVRADPGAPYTFERGDVVATLHDTPCVNEKVNGIVRAPEQFRAADVLWKGEPFAACWTVIATQVVLVDETGDAGYLALDGFRDERTPLSGTAL